MLQPTWTKATSLGLHTCFFELVDEEVDSSSQPRIAVVMMMGIADIHTRAKVVSAIIDESKTSTNSNQSGSMSTHVRQKSAVTGTISKGVRKGLKP